MRKLSDGAKTTIGTCPLVIRLGADGWSCENGDSTTSYPKERVASVTYN